MLTNKEKNNIMKSLYDKIKSLSNGISIFSDTTNDLLRMSLLENIMCDSICENKLKQLLGESSKEVWDDKIMYDLVQAGNMISKYLPLFRTESYRDNYFEKVDNIFKKIYERMPRLCQEIFPVIYIIIIENANKLIGIKDNKLYDFIEDNLLGCYREDYIYLLLEKEYKEKVSDVEKQKNYFRKIFKNPNNELIKYLFSNDISIKDTCTDVDLDIDTDLNVDISDWSDEEILKHCVWIKKLRSEYFRKSILDIKEAKNECPEKMYASFQFITEFLDSEDITFFKNTHKELILYTINKMTSWINVLFLYYRQAKYIFLEANTGLYSVSNYLIYEKSELRDKVNQFRFFIEIGELLMNYEILSKAYEDGENDERFKINQVMKNRAEEILEFIEDCLDESKHNQLSIYKAFDYALFTYLAENTGKRQFEPSFSLDEMLEKYYSKSQGNENME